MIVKKRKSKKKRKELNKKDRFVLIRKIANNKFRLSIKMVQKVNSDVEVNKPAYMYYLMSKSGQCSPTTSDTLDSGTGSDIETTSTTNNRNTYTLPTSLSLTNAVSKSMRKFNELSLDGGDGVGGQRRLKSSHSSNDSYNTDSEESESSLSCDSLNSNEIMRMKNNTTAHIIRTSPFGSSTNQCGVVEPSEGAIFTSDENNVTKINFLPRSLLQDIRDRSMTIAKNQSNASSAAAAVSAAAINNNTNNTHTQAHSEPNKTNERNDAYRNGNKTIIVKSHLKECINNTSANYTNEQSNLHQQRDTIAHKHSNNINNNFGGHSNAPHGQFNGQLRRIMRSTSGSDSDNEPRSIYENDKYISFHLNERMDNDHTSARATIERPRDDDSFAGYRDIRAASSLASTIRSSKGTIRGVKNRVRNGIATFLQMQQTNVKVRLRFGFLFPSLACNCTEYFLYRYCLQY